jgi:hypothetical protein
MEIQSTRQLDASLGHLDYAWHVTPFTDSRAQGLCIDQFLHRFLPTDWIWLWKGSAK